MADTAPMDPVGNEDEDKKDTETIPEVGPNWHRHDLPELPDLLAQNVPHDLNRELLIMNFVRAQSAFIRAQIYFLEVGRAQTDDVSYIQHLTGFATAQSAFIKAQQDYLQVFGQV